ncbi:Cys-tRNA(Pro) deacylase [Sulfurospirillum sp. 1612]|uniref:Cys-tRNA(Pro) deacylase n=1 Tax=Sulfurospirillum sp. 1612 TaxID=3094835 RepID=UPI002F94A3EF
MKKSNAARILDQHHIEYELFSYQVDPNDLSATHAAESLQQNHEIVFKTLVVCDENQRPIVACIPADYELDLKALAKSANCKKCTMLPLKNLLKTTGYLRGGCSPIGMKKQYKTFMHHTALQYDKILISAGLRGLQLYLNPRDLQNIIEIEFENLCIINV